MSAHNFRFPKPFQFAHVGKDEDPVRSLSGVIEPAADQSASSFPPPQQAFTKPVFTPADFSPAGRPNPPPPQATNPRVLEQLDQLDHLSKLPLEDLMTYENKKKQTQGFQPESYALPGAFAERDPHQAEREMALKLQALVDKLKEYKDHIKELSKQNMDLSKEAYEKGKKAQELEVEKGEMEQELAAYGLQGRGGKDKYGTLKLISRNALDEEEQKRRNDQKRDLMMGIALVDGEIGDFLGGKDSQKNCLQRFSESMYRILLRFTLLKGDLKHIEAYYDKSIAAYFTFYKYLVNASLFLLLVFGYLLISHPFRAEDKSLGICGGSPCILQYYSYAVSEDITYISTLVVLIIITLTAAIWKWIRSEAFRRRKEIITGKDSKKKQYASIVFNNWDWTIRTQADTADRSVNLYNILSTYLADDVRRAEAENMSQAQRTRLTVRRIFSLILNTCVLVAGWVGIIMILTFSSNFSNLFSSSSKYILFLIKLVPVLAVAFVNAVVPAITLKLTTLEQWVDPGFIVKVQIIKLYTARIMNAFIYAVLNLDLAVNLGWFGTSSRIEFQSDSFNCREDQTGQNLVMMVISDAIVSKLVGLGLPLFDKMWASCTKKPMLKREIKVAQQVINLVYSQTLIWIAYPYYPYVAVLGPIFLYIDFKFQLWRLEKLLAKPKEQTLADVSTHTGHRSPHNAHLQPHLRADPRLLHLRPLPKPPPQHLQFHCVMRSFPH